LPKSIITAVLERLSSNKTVKYGVYFAAIFVFLGLILLPPILGIIIKFGAIQGFLGKTTLVDRALTAVRNSFVVAIIVSTLDLVAGIPMAWFVARGTSKWLNVVDTLGDIPFIVPTAALGYSLLLFWNKPEGISFLFGSSLIAPGWLLVMLLHFTFSFPVVVRVIVGALLDYKVEFERASRTLGAPPLMAARTVTFPIIRPSIIAAFVLAFSRSLSETGATILVAGAFENGSVFIQNIQTVFNKGLIDQATYDGSTVFTSFVLIVTAISVFIVIRFLGPRMRIPVKKAWPSFERKLSYSKAESSRNIVTLVAFAIVVLLPSLFVALPAFQAIFGGTLIQSFTGSGIWANYWQSLLLSYFLAAIVTLLNVVIGLPMAILIARRKLGKLTATTLDLLVNIPLIVPSIALGLSLKIFWTQNFGSIPELVLLILAHLAITYPYFVRSMTAAVERISVDMEEASRTLGAKPLAVFTTVILPLTKYSILSGAILVFTRSLSETGATVAVATTLQTTPVIIVNWVKQQIPGVTVTSLQIGLGCGFLILFSFITLLVLRLVVRGRGRY
jgi:thiamine transport system permease protein